MSDRVVALGEHEATVSDAAFDAMKKPAVPFGPLATKVSISKCSIKNLPVERGDYGERRFMPYAHAPVTWPEKQEKSE